MASQAPPQAANNPPPHNQNNSGHQTGSVGRNNNGNAWRHNSYKNNNNNNNHHNNNNNDGNNHRGGSYKKGKRGSFFNRAPRPTLDGVHGPATDPPNMNAIQTPQQPSMGAVYGNGMYPQSAPPSLNPGPQNGQLSFNPGLQNVPPNLNSGTIPFPIMSPPNMNRMPVPLGYNILPQNMYRAPFGAVYGNGMPPQSSQLNPNAMAYSMSQGNMYQVSTNGYNMPPPNMRQVSVGAGNMSMPAPGQPGPSMPVTPLTTAAMPVSNHASGPHSRVVSISRTIPPSPNAPFPPLDQGPVSRSHAAMFPTPSNFPVNRTSSYQPKPSVGTQIQDQPEKDQAEKEQAEQENAKEKQTEKDRIAKLKYGDDTGSKTKQAMNLIADVLSMLDENIAQVSRLPLFERAKIQSTIEGLYTTYTAKRMLVEKERSDTLDKAKSAAKEQAQFDDKIKERTILMEHTLKKSSSNELPSTTSDEDREKTRQKRDRTLLQLMGNMRKATQYSMEAADCRRKIDHYFTLVSEHDRELAELSTDMCDTMWKEINKALHAQVSAGHREDDHSKVVDEISADTSTRDTQDNVEQAIEHGQLAHHGSVSTDSMSDWGQKPRHNGYSNYGKGAQKSRKWDNVSHVSGIDDEGCANQNPKTSQNDNNFDSSGYVYRGSKPNIFNDAQQAPMLYNPNGSRTDSRPGSSDCSLPDTAGQKMGNRHSKERTGPLNRHLPISARPNGSKSDGTGSHATKSEGSTDEVPVPKTDTNKGPKHKKQKHKKSGPVKTNVSVPGFQAEWELQQPTQFSAVDVPKVDGPKVDVPKVEAPEAHAKKVRKQRKASSKANKSKSSAAKVGAGKVEAEAKTAGTKEDTYASKAAGKHVGGA